MALWHFPKKLAVARTGTHPAGRRPQAGWGTRARRSRYPRGYIWSFCRPALRSCSPRKGCGLFEQRRAREPLLRGHLEGLEEALAEALRGVVRSAGDHPILHAPPLLVAGSGMKSKSIRPDSV